MEQIVLCEEVDAFVIEERACIRCDLCQEQEQTRAYRSNNIEKSKLFGILFVCVGISRRMIIQRDEENEELDVGPPMQPFRRFIDPH